MRLHFLVCVETHIRTMCNLGFAMFDVMKRSDVPAN